ncbi:peptidase inhibitor family I36 protein [Actinomadura harenae]|uniref:peptidase inhibitor family I36 protein n=1 Tax=Actinomadura harenae TaxID=2483351 RepID=UPI0013156733|nr:peptidase inhibitor family I36 protein [Actinomadura harenae]
MNASEIISAEEFGEYLRKLRGRLTQQAVARHSNIDRDALTRQRVSNIENGALPTAQQLRCYLHGCDRLGVLDGLEPVRQRIEESAARAKRAGDPTGPTGVHRVSRRLAVTVVAVAGTTAAVTGVAVALFMGRYAGDGAPEATTAPGVPDCVDGSVCFWPEPNFIGRKITLPPDYFTDSTCQPLPFVARSVQNNSRERQRLFAGTSCTGQVTILQHLNRAPLPSVAVLSFRHS